jgi:glycosyltransferase involved in cell wall biosynthesis
MTLAVCRAFFPGMLLKRFLHRRLYPHARRVIVISAGIGDDLERRIGLRGGRVQVIHNPCETEPVRRLARGEPGLSIDWRIPTVVAAA